MKQFFLDRLRAIGHAFRGWGFVMRTQRNAWVHAFISTAVIIVAIWLHVAPLDWALLVLAMGMVWSAEIMNTAIEAVVDLASPVHHPLARVGKDVGAAAVLIAAGAAVIIGLLVLGPPLWDKLKMIF